VGYWIWYLVTALLAWAFKLPQLLLLWLLVLAGRRWMPDPIAWLHRTRRIHELEAQVRTYPGDLLARRRLAAEYLEAARPLPASALLEEAIAKGLRDDEAFYLLGMARLRAGDPAEALSPIVRSVRGNEKLLYGEPYFAAAEALIALRRLDEAQDALERGLAVNSSHVAGHVRLGRVRAARGDRAGARRAWRAAVDTWKQLPEYLKWKTLRPYAAARWALLRRA
jgi:tetratricopeptide (TPR) repeat protein